MFAVACKITLDTVDFKHLLSEENRKVTRLRRVNYKSSLDFGPQVLSREPLTGRCYWECEWDVSGGNYLDMGVAYQSIDRDTYLTSSDKSWVLGVYDNKYYVFHPPFSAGVPLPPSRSGRVGVFLDREAGTLSFYSVCSDTRTHLHTFKTTFTNETLYAGFTIEHKDCSVTLC